MNTSSFTFYFKKLKVCSKVFVECMICLGELEELCFFFLFNHHHILLMRVWVDIFSLKMGFFLLK